jgi:exopolyphosphatase/guanosine-5'-triphosphate,3'-diphosphate pyrophosphatase
VAYHAAVLDLAAPLPESVAAVDLGSNSFHLIVARINAGEIVIVDRLREMVQLAAGLDADRRLDDEASERAIDCLKRFGERVRHMPAGTVRAVGTNTLRSARQADEFLLEAEEALGHPIETISGIEEARLIYLGVAHSLANQGSRRLVLDIGGGSTELIIGEDFEPLLMESLYLGCVTASRRYFGDGKIEAKGWRKCELAALQELEPVRTRYRDAGWEEAVGASGTVRSVAAVVEASGWSKRGITPKALRRLRDAILEAGHVDGLDFEGLNPARRPVFPGGVALLSALFESLQIERLLPADGALREGLLNDLVGRIRQEDVRRRSVTALADRYHVDWKQAHRVEYTALQLLVQTSDAWGLDSVGHGSTRSVSTSPTSTTTTTASTSSPSPTCTASRARSRSWWRRWCARTGASFRSRR